MSSVCTPRIVLVSPSHPGNIGSTARAMKTMGLAELYLVNPKDFPSPQALELAAGADDIIYNARVVTSLLAAISDCQQIFATSARSRELQLPELTPAAAAKQIISLPAITKTAIVFGNERSGLSNDEILFCNYQISIPTIAEYSSLNLAQSVQIMAYEWFIKATNVENKPIKQQIQLADSAVLENFYIELKEVLIALEFLKPANPRKLFQRIRRLFNRAQLELLEINILRGILTQIKRKISLSSTCRGLSTVSMDPADKPREVEFDKPRDVEFEVKS